MNASGGMLFSRQNPSLFLSLSEKNSAAVEPITTPNPYRTTVLEKAGKKYEAVYYFTHVYKPDDIISEDELMPLVFESGKLVGIGSDFVFKLKE